MESKGGELGAVQIQIFLEPAEPSRNKVVPINPQDVNKPSRLL